MEGKENYISITDPVVTAELGGHSTLNEVKEISLTESAVVDDSIVHSTPISSKKSDDNDIIIVLRTISSSIDNINRRFDINDIKFDEQNVKLNEVINSMNRILKLIVNLMK